MKVNGTSKFTHGKGFRLFFNSIIPVDVQESLVETGKHPTWFLAFDLSILSLVEKQEPDDKLASDIMKKGLFTYLLNNTKNKQIIIVENCIPDVEYGDTNIIRFTKTGYGRYGFVQQYNKLNDNYDAMDAQGGERNSMNDKLNELLSRKLSKSPAILKEYAALIGKQYTDNVEIADTMWDSIINKYGENEYYFSVLRLRNEIARNIGMNSANNLLLCNTDRVRKLLSATKGSKAFKIYEFCPPLIMAGEFDKVVQLLTCLDNSDVYFEDVEKVIYYLQRDVITREYQEKNSDHDSSISIGDYLDRNHVNDFMKICSERFAKNGLQGVGAKWYIEGPKNTNETENVPKMESDISNVMSLFPDCDSEMATTVLEVANECYVEQQGRNYRSFSFSIDISSFVDDLLRQKIKKQFPELDDAEIERYISESREKREQKEAIEKAKREKLKAEIKNKIQGNPKIGWRIAYHLCDGQDTEKTRSIRYSLVNKIPDISLEEKIAICEKYLGDLINDDTTSKNSISSVYREIVEILIQSGNEAYLDSVDKYYELACKYADDKLQVIKCLIDFCTKNGLKVEADKWRKRLLNVELSDANCKIDPRYFLKSGFDFNNTDMLEDVIKRLDYSEYGMHEIIRTLIDNGCCELAERVLDNLEILERKKKMPTGDSLYWIASMKYRMKYYKKGYSFCSLWNPIRFYDHLQSKEVEFVARLKEQYAAEFEQHRKYITDLELLKCTSGEQKEYVYNEYIESCKAEIHIVPKLIEFIKAFRNFASNNTSLVKHIYNTDEILNNDIYKLLNCSAFKDLSIYYEKQGFYSEAIEVCDAAIACGYVKDGTKGGMSGRREKLKKKR